jgi:hypothetical protein
MVVTAIVAAVGVKLTFFGVPAAEATRFITTASIDIYQMHLNSKDLPVQRIHDLAFVFPASH